MASTFSLMQNSCFCSLELTKTFPKSLPPRKEDDLRAGSPRLAMYSRRSIIVRGGVSLIAIFAGGSSLTPLPVKAEGENSKVEDDEGANNADASVVDAIKSLFDPNERSKSGKVLPKAYLKSAREVVKTLRESLGEDGKDVAKFRRSADAAKESIREYLSTWRGQQAVAAEESYMALEKAIRSLAGFYSKAGPFASLPEDIKASILEDLNAAEVSL